MYIVELERIERSGGVVFHYENKKYIAHNKRGLIKLLNAHRFRNSGSFYHYRFIRPVHVYKQTEFIDLEEINTDINSFLVNVDFEEVENFFEEDYAHLNIDFTMVVDADGCRAVMSFDEDGERESVVITKYPKVTSENLIDKDVSIEMCKQAKEIDENNNDMEEEEMFKKKKENKDKQEMNVSREKVGGNTVYTVSEDANSLKLPEHKVVLNGIKVAEKADIEDLHAEIDCLRTELASLEGQNVALEAVIDALVEDVAELNKAQVKNEKKEKQLGHEEVINALVDDVERLYQKVLDLERKEKQRETAKRIQEEIRRLH